MSVRDERDRYEYALTLLHARGDGSFLALLRDHQEVIEDCIRVATINRRQRPSLSVGDYVEVLVGQRKGKRGVVRPREELHESCRSAWDVGVLEKVGPVRGYNYDEVRKIS